MTEGEITRVLVRLRERGSDAVNELFPVVYRQLRGIARGQAARGGSDPTLNPTALVNEAYLKLVDQTRAEWQDRRHFFSVAAMAMRQIVVDHARQRRSKKRGGGVRKTTLDEGRIRIDERADEILAVDEALTRLGSLDDRLRRVVELRFFAGLSIEEIAEILEVTDRTVKRDWRKAKAFLYKELSSE